MFDAMHTWFKAKEYFNYLLRSEGAGKIHSPFVFDFIQNVLRDSRTFYCYEEIESLREELLLMKDEIQVNDFGAGSHISESAVRSISAIAKNSSTPKKFAQLLFRIGNYYQCRKILELGTSLGITTLYLSSVSNDANVISIEGDHELCEEAKENFTLLEAKNISVIEGNFDEKLLESLKSIKHLDLAYVDGNHRKESTLNYINTILPFTNEKSILIFGDIHWSPEMKEAWEEIKSLEQVKVTIDLFFIGIVFFREGLSRQDFVLHF